MAADPSLIDRVVIVTGGSRGLGKEMALTLVEAGARVAVVGLTDSAHLAADRARTREAVAGDGPADPDRRRPAARRRLRSASRPRPSRPSARSTCCSTMPASACR